MKYITKIVIIILFIFSCTQSNIIQPIKDDNLPSDYEEAELDPKIYIYDESNDKLLNNIIISLKNSSRVLRIKNNRENSVNFLIRIDGGNNYLLDKGTETDKTQLSFTLNGNNEVSITIKKNSGVSSYPDLTLKVVCSYQNFGTYTFTLSNKDNSNDPFNGYYASIEGKTGTELKNALYTLLNTSIKRRFTYSECWDAIKYTDEDPSNDNNVILAYTNWSIPKSKAGTDVDGWNREHTWPQSRGNLGTNVGPGTDLHHLRACDVTVNSARGNLEFDNGGNIYYDSSPYPGYSTNTGCKKDSDSWEPIDSLKGDVARMIFYMDVAYDKKGGVDFVDLVINNIIPNPTTNSSPAYFGKLSTLKQWHQNDPPDYIEKRRNERIYELQGNRNPFIDKPELVDQLF